MLSAATIVAKHTSALCNACRLASSKTPNPVAKRQFVQSAKEVANTTANLVKSIKVRVIQHPGDVRLSNNEGVLTFGLDIHEHRADFFDFETASLTRFKCLTGMNT